MNHKCILAAAAFLTVCPLSVHAQATTPPSTLTPPPASAPAAQSVLLRYKFAVGQVHRYQIDMGMNMRMLTGQTGAGIPVNMAMQMTMRQTVKSLRPADGAATLAIQIEAMHMLGKDGQETPLTAAQQTMMKKPFTQVMLPTGKILSMQAPQVGGAGLPGMDFSKGMFNSTVFLPAGPVKIGSTWAGAVSAAMAGMQATSLSTLIALDQKEGVTMATIQSKQRGTMGMTITKGLPPPMMMKMLGKISGHGDQIFDVTAGAVQNATQVMNMDMKMTFGRAAAGKMPPGMPTAMKMQMQMKMTMQRLDDTVPATAPLAPVQ